MKILVTGAAGFIGSTIVDRALREGHNVVGIDALTDYYSPEIKRRNLSAALDDPSFTFRQADLNTVDLSDVLDGVDVVYHQAGQPGVRKSWGRDFVPYVEANVLGTQRLLEACVNRSSLRRLVYASSSSIYGDAAVYPTTEKDRPQPVSPYGVTKLAAEHLCTLYGRNHGVPTVSLRYFTVYGPRQRPDMAFTRFLTAARDGQAIQVYGSGGQVRDFTYVDDVVDANVRAAATELEPGSVYNVAGGSSVSLLETLDILEEITRLEVRRDFREAVPGDVWRTGGSIDQITGATGWRPLIDLREGLKRHWDWMSGSA